MANGASRTALATALMRAVHTRRDKPRLIDDAWGDRLVSENEKVALYQRIMRIVDGQTKDRLERLGSQQLVLDTVLRRHQSYGGVILRAHYTEDVLADAVQHGVGQYVLIGAGFDSFIVRRPPFARALWIYELDQPVSQAMKRARLAACGLTLGPDVRFVATDFGRESLAAALARSGFSPSQPAFFSWLGVSMYLSSDANWMTLRSIAAVAAPGSELVFTYIDQRAFDGPAVERFETVRTRLAAAGEPWLSGFHPAKLPEELATIGLELIEDLDGVALVQRLSGEPAGLYAGVLGHIAHVRVPNRH